LCSGASTQADSTNDSICAYWELTYALIDTMKENSLVRIDFVFATSIKWFTVASTTELQCSAWTITGVNTQGETYTIVNSTSLISYISYESNTEYIFKISGEQPLFTLTPPSQYLRHIKSE
jgi:hypothetical protein